MKALGIADLMKKINSDTARIRRGEKKKGTIHGKKDLGLLLYEDVWEGLTQASKV